MLEANPYLTVFCGPVTHSAASPRVIWVGGRGVGAHCCLVISQLGDHHLWSTFSPGSASVPSQVGDVINKERHWRENNEFLSFHCFELSPFSPTATGGVL